MSGHLPEELPRLLTGEAPRDVVLAAAAHLRGCPDCRQELVSAVVAHAALSSARRFAPELVAAVAEGTVDPALPAPAEPLPELPPRRTGAGPRRSRLRRRTALAAAAVAVGAVAGVAGTVAAQHLSSSAPATRTVALHAYDRGTEPASATLAADGRLRVDASSLPDPGPDRRYEVWLTDRARSALQPVGWVGADGTASMTVPTKLLQRYQDIEVSVQDLNSPKYLYSGVSVLRGSYQ